MARRLAASLPGGTLAAARDATTSNTVATLAAYRKHCAINSPSVQLILPEALKLLPLYALALLKGPALRVRYLSLGHLAGISSALIFEKI
jgi:protein transport protein SEC24